jgi:hypothetical protein
MSPSKGGRCCQSTPRCASCPVWRAADLLELRQLGEGAPDLPPHLGGIPVCLHKYEAMFRPEPEADALAAEPGEAA